MARNSQEADNAEVSPLLASLDTGRFSQEQETHRSTRKAKTSRMKLLDNLRGWDKPKKFRYLLLLALSLSGDGW